jgi:hypothetical protein
VIHYSYFKKKYAKLRFILILVISSSMIWSCWDYFMGAHMLHFTSVHLTIIVSLTPARSFFPSVLETDSDHSLPRGSNLRQLTLLPPPAPLAHSPPPPNARNKLKSISVLVILMPCQLLITCVESDRGTNSRCRGFCSSISAVRRPFPPALTSC